MFSRKYIPFALVLLGAIAFWGYMISCLFNDCGFNALVVMGIIGIYLLIILIVAIIYYSRRIKKSDNSFSTKALLKLSFVTAFSPVAIFTVTETLLRFVKRIFFFIDYEKGLERYSNISWIFTYSTEISLVALLGIGLVYLPKKKVLGSVFVLITILGLAYPFADAYFDKKNSVCTRQDDFRCTVSRALVKNDINACDYIFHKHSNSCKREFPKLQKKIQQCVNETTDNQGLRVCLQYAGTDFSYRVLDDKKLEEITNNYK